MSADLPAPTTADIVIHIGPHKTGSTHIQGVVRRNRAAFKARCKTFIMGDPALDDLAKAAKRMHRALGRPRVRANMATRLEAAARAFFAEHGRGDRPLFLSHEFFAGRMIGLSGDWLIFPAMAAIADRLAAAAAPRSVVIAAYRRDHDDWIKSAHNQAVRTNRLDLSLNDFAEKVAQGDMLDLALERLETEAHLPEVRVFDMDAEAAGPLGLGAGLFGLLGFEPTEIQAFRLPATTNPSLNAASLAFMREVNRSALNRGTTIKIARILRRRQDLFRPDHAGD